MTDPSCDGVPFAGLDDAGGDAQNSMDERDLDVAVTVGAPLDERQGGQRSLGGRFDEQVGASSRTDAGARLCADRPIEMMRGR